MDLGDLLKRFEGEDLEFRAKFRNEEDKDRDIRTIVSFFNTRGGVLIFGVSEDGADRRIVGLDLQPQVIENNLTTKMRGKCTPEMRVRIEIIPVNDNIYVIAVHCPRGKTPPYLADGIAYVRRNSATLKASDDEIAELYKQRQPEFDKTVLDGSVIEDMDLDLLETVYERRQGRQIIKGDLQKLLIRNGLAVKEDSGFHLTMAGLLLFGKTPQHFLPHAKILAQIQSSENPTEWEFIGQFEGNVFSQLEQAGRFLNDHLRKSAVIVGFERREELEVPIESLREAVVNALVHRDYHDAKSEIQISISPQQVRITSPGGLVAPLTMKEIADGAFIPTSRNPVVAETLLSMGLMDKRGTGIKRMSLLAVEAGLKEPIIREITGGTAFEVIFERKPLPAKTPERRVSLPGEVLEKLNDEERKVLLVLEKNERITPREIETALGFSRPKVNAILDGMVQKELLTRSASSKHDPKLDYVLHSRFLKLPTPKKKAVDNRDQTSLFGP